MDHKGSNGTLCNYDEQQKDLNGLVLHNTAIRANDISQTTILTLYMVKISVGIVNIAVVEKTKCANLIRCDPCREPFDPSF
jgi:hypothetical protein